MNPENQINGKQEVRKMSKNDHRHENEKTIRPKNELYCIELNIYSMKSYLLEVYIMF